MVGFSTTYLALLFCPYSKQPLGDSNQMVAENEVQNPGPNQPGPGVRLSQ
jgi:hypothetical protein